MNNITLIALITTLAMFVLVPGAFFDPVLAQKNEKSSENIEKSISTLINKLTRGIILDSPIKSIQESMGVNTSTVVSTPNIEPSIHASPSSDKESNIQVKNDEIITPVSKEQDLNIIVPNSGQNKFTAEITQVSNLEINSQVNKPVMIYSETMDNFNKELIKFCADSESDSFSCVDTIKESLNALEFTNSYSGPSQMNVPIGNYIVKLSLH